MSSQPRRSQRFFDKSRAERRAHARERIRIQLSIADSKVFPTLHYKAPRGGDNYITVIHPPILQRNSLLWLVPTNWGGKYRTDQPFLECPLSLLAHSPELLLFWRAHKARHPSPDLFSDFLDSLEKPFIPVVGSGAVVRFKADKATADQLLFPFCRVRQTIQMKGLLAHQNDSAMYIVDHLNHTWVVSTSEAEIAADPRIKLGINPPHPTLSDQQMKGGAIARSDFDIVANIDDSVSDQTRAFLIKASLQQSEYDRICSQNTARGELAWSFIDTIEQNGISAYRGKLRANKCGKRTFAQMGVLSKAAFIGGLQKRFRDFTDLQWTKPTNYEWNGVLIFFES